MDVFEFNDKSLYMIIKTILSGDGLSILYFLRYFSVGGSTIYYTIKQYIII